MKINTLISRPAVRYLLIGGTVYVFEIIVIALAQQAGARPTLAVAIGFTLGTIVSFILQKFVTFGDHRRKHRIIMVQVAATLALVAWNFGFSVGLTAMLQDVLPATVIRTIALAITTIWNFYLYKTHIFKPAD